MQTLERITLEPGKRGGRPCIRGLRITVYDVLSMFANGMAEAEILEDFPELEAADLKASLQSPPWHEAELQAAETALATGQAGFLSLDEAKKRLARIES